LANVEALSKLEHLGYHVLVGMSGSAHIGLDCILDPFRSSSNERRRTGS